MSDRQRWGGIITFFASHHAMRAERVLLDSGFAVRLLPGPRDLSPNCGVALAFDIAQRQQVEEILRQARVLYEAVHPYDLPPPLSPPAPPDRPSPRPGLVKRGWLPLRRR